MAQRFRHNRNRCLLSGIIFQRDTAYFSIDSQNFGARIVSRLKLGIALGSGSARGWAHIGVLKALSERGIRPDVICGASIGSLVAAAYASEQMDILEEWVRSLRRIDVLRLLDASFRGGVIRGSRVMSAVGSKLEDRLIEDLPMGFGAVATDLETGREVWIRSGPMLRAVRLSSGLPGLFAPARHDDRWLVDGGVVNPVPVSMCYAIGADVVIGINLNHHLVSRRFGTLSSRSTRETEEEPAQSASEEAQERGLLDRLAERVGSMLPSFGRDDPGGPGIIDVVGTTINIMQERITASRMAGEAPHMVLSPNLGQLQVMDFHRADDAIAIGAQCVEEADARLDEIRQLIG